MKFIATVLFIVAVSLQPVGAYLALGIAWLIIVGLSALAHVGPLRPARRAFLAFPFLLAAFPLVFTRPEDPIGTLVLGPLTLTISGEGLRMFTTIALKSWISVQAALLLAFTTPFHDLVDGLRQLHLPRIMVAIISFMYRYLGVLSDEATRMARARASRSADPDGHGGGSIVWKAKVTGSMVGSLFLRSYERSERIYAAMQARGFEGEFRHMHSRSLVRVEYAGLAIALLACLALVVLGHFLLPLMDRVRTLEPLPAEMPPVSGNGHSHEHAHRHDDRGADHGHGHEHPAGGERIDAPAAVAIVVEHLHFRYPDGFEALHGIDLSIGAGEKVAIVGPNGAGKSTLLLHLNGILEPSHGSIRVDGTVVDRSTRRRIRAQVGVVFQDPDDQLFSPTVFEDVAFGPLHMGVDKAEIHDRVERALASVGMAGFERRMPHRMSLGQRKRVALATVLSMDPQVLVFDEPSAGLDPRGRRELIEVLRGLRQTTLVSTHDMRLVEEVFPRTVIVDDGRIVADGPTDRILADDRLLEAHGLERP